MPEFSIEYTEDGGIRVVEIPPEFQENARIGGIPISGDPEDDEIIKYEEGEKPKFNFEADRFGTLYDSDDFDTDFSNKTTDELSEGKSNLYFTETRVAQVPEVSKNTDERHTQGTDKGTTNESFELDTGSDENVRIKSEGEELQVRRGDDVTFADLRVRDLNVEGDTTVVESETVVVNDNILKLNTNVSGTPTEDAGISVERGDQKNARINWNENLDRWEAGTEGSLEDIATSSTKLTDLNNDLDTGDVPEGSNLYYTQTRFDSDFNSKTTDDLSEGQQSLYYTDERARDAVLTSVSGNQGVTFNYDETSNTATITLSNLDEFTTSDLSEGSNLYFTKERVDDRVGNLLKAGNGIDITYDDSENQLVITDLESDIELIQDKAWSVLGGSQKLINVAYDDINDEVDFEVESDLAQYDNTNSNFISDLSTKSTDKLPEGSSNLYFTEERVDDRVDELLFGGVNVNLNYDDINGTLTISAEDATRSDQEIKDEAWDVLGGTENLIDVIYDGTDRAVDFLVESDLSKYDNSTSGFISDLSSFTTDDLKEGINKFYYTQSRFDSDFNSKSTDDLSEGSSNLYYTESRTISAIQQKQTLSINELEASQSSTFESDLLIQGNLTVEGEEFISNTETVTTTDNTLILNENEVGAGISSKTAGLEIDRGSLEPYVASFSESDDEFRVGVEYTEIAYSNLSGSFQFNEEIVGQSSGATATVFEDTGSVLKLKAKNGSFVQSEAINGKTSAASADVDSITRVQKAKPSFLREDNPVDNAVVYWDNSQKIAVTDSGFTFDGTTLTVPDLNVTGISDSSLSTSDIQEDPSNLYFTEERAQDAVGTSLVAGDNISINYDDSGDQINFSISAEVGHGVLNDGTQVTSSASSINFGENLTASDSGNGNLLVTSQDTQLTKEEVQDFAFGNTLSGLQDLISVVYDDANNEIDFSVQSDLSQYDNSTTGYISGISGFTSDDLSEGTSNLYFTDERAQDAVLDSLTGGANTTVTYDDPNNKITISSSDTQLTDEEVQDAVYQNVLSGSQTLISVTYDDTNNEVGYTVDDDLSNYDNSTTGFISDISSFTTDDLTEGTSSVYYLDSRVDSLITGGTGISTTFTSGDPTSGTLELNTSISPFSTDDLSEGTSNLYFTDARAVSAVESANPLTLSGSVKLQDSFGFGTGTTVTEIKTSASSSTNDDSLITEGAAVSYVNTQIGTLDTDDVTEGTNNLYFTEERVQDAVNTVLTGGANVTLSYDDAANNLTVESQQLTEEQVQDLAFSSTLSGIQNLISVTYDDTNNEVDFSVQSDLSQFDNSTSGFTTYGSSDFDTDFTSKTTDDLSEGTSNLYFTDERVDDRVSTLLTGGANTTITYDDAGNLLTIDSEDTVYQGGTDITIDSNNNINFDGLSDDTTDDLSEGTNNLYFTESRVFQAGQNQLFPGDRISITEDSGNETFTFAVTGNSALQVENSTGAVTSDASILRFTNEFGVTNPAGEEASVALNVDTDDISEGTENLYFTDQRVFTANQNQLLSGTGINIVEDATNNTFTIEGSGFTAPSVSDGEASVLSEPSDINFGTDLDVVDDGDGSVTVNFSANLSEAAPETRNNGNNVVSSTSIYDFGDFLSVTNPASGEAKVVADITISGGSNVTVAKDTTNNSFTVDSTDTQLTNEEVQDAVYSNVLSGTQTLINVSYDDTNNEVDYVVNSDLSQYDNSTSGFISGLSSFTTDDLSEGSNNLYYTDERAQDAVNGLLNGGTNVNLSYDDANDSLTINVPEALTQEEAQDAIYNNVLSGTQTRINVTYDDANNEVDYIVDGDLSSYSFANVTSDDVSEGTSNLYFQDSRAITALENATSVSFSGDVGLSSGTSVNNIKTTINSTSDNALVTEEAVVEEINNQNFTSNAFLDVIQKSTSFTPADSETGSVYFIDGDVTVTLPTGLSEGWNAIFVNRGGGTITFTTQTNATLNSAFDQNTLDIKNAQAPVVQRSDNFYLGGQLGT